MDGSDRGILNEMLTMQLYVFWRNDTILTAC